MALHFLGFFFVWPVVFKLLCPFLCASNSLLYCSNYSIHFYEPEDYNIRAIYLMDKIWAFFSEFKWTFIPYTNLLQRKYCNSWRFWCCLQFWSRFSSKSLRKGVAFLFYFFLWTEMTIVNSLTICTEVISYQIWKLLWTVSYISHSTISLEQLLL